MSCQSEADRRTQAQQDYDDAKKAHDMADADVAAAERTLALDATAVCACNVTLIFTPVFGPATVPVWVTCKALALAKLANDGVALDNAQKKAAFAKVKLERAEKKLKKANHDYDTCLKHAHQIYYV